MARRRYWNLKLSSWERMCFSAQHWYGTLWLPAKNMPGELAYKADEQIMLEYVVTAKHVAMFDKIDPGYAPEEGSMSARFWTRDEAMATGLRTFEERSQDGDLLLLNHGGNPVEPLAIKGPDTDHLFSKLRAIWREYETLSVDYMLGSSEVKRLTRKWDRLIEAK